MPLALLSDVDWRFATYVPVVRLTDQSVPGVHKDHVSENMRVLQAFGSVDQVKGDGDENGRFLDQEHTTPQPSHL
ncbi:MAG: hypothetical protein HY327_09085 [Chloroflexi bacterium]|nr:hypothetical protein [Chloroflexota bacterium]